MSEDPGFRDPMAWIAIGLASVVLATGLIFTAIFDPPVIPTGMQETSPPPTTPPPSPEVTESPSPVETSPPAEVTLAPLFADASGNAPPVDRGGGQQDTYEAANAVDGDDATAWCIPGDGIGEYLILGFDGTIEVAEIALIPGYDKIDPETGDDRFQENRRILDARFVFDDGTTYTRGFDPPTRELATARLPTPASTQTMRIEVLDTTEPSQPNRDYTCISTVVVRGYT